MTVRPFDEILRDFVIPGVPASGPHHPYKPDFRDSLNALIAGPFPDNRVIKLNNANEGTPNNIVVTASVAIPAAAYQVLYILNVTQENTGPVTVSGAINRDLVTNTSRPVEPGYLKPGMALLCIDTGTELRLLSYGDAEAILAAAEAAADRAEAAAAGLNLPAIDSGDAGKTLIVNSDGSGYDLRVSTVEYNVKTYGAEGQGVTLDRQAFIDADNDAPAGYDVIVPAGVYNIGPGDLSLTGRRFRFHGQVSITGGRLIGAVIEQVEASSGSVLYGTGVGDASTPAVANYKFGRVLNNMFRKGLQIGGADPSETPDGTALSLDSQIGWPVLQPTRWGNAIEFAVQSNARSWRGNIVMGQDVVRSDAPIFDATVVGKYIYVEDLIFRISELITPTEVRVVNLDGSGATFPYTRAVTILICYVGGSGTAQVVNKTVTRLSGEPFVPKSVDAYYVRINGSIYLLDSWNNPDEITLNTSPGDGVYSYEWWTTINHLSSRLVVQRANGLAGSEEMVALEAYASGSFRLQALSSSGTFPFNQRPFHFGNGYNSDATQRTHILLDGSLGSTIIGGGYEKYSLRVLHMDNQDSNALSVAGATSGFPVAIRTEGKDSDIDILLAPKGGGYVRLGQSITGHATDGTPRSLFIKDQDGRLIRLSGYQI